MFGIAIPPRRGSLGRMEAGTPPISAEVWARLKRLDATCSISLARGAPHRDPRWKRYPRVWVVRIAPRKGMAGHCAHCEHPSVAEAIAAACGEAERQGWGDPYRI